MTSRNLGERNSQGRVFGLSRTRHGPPHGTRHRAAATASSWERGEGANSGSIPPSSYRMYSLIGFRKSTPPQNRGFIVKRSRTTLNTAWSATQNTAPSRKKERSQLWGTRCFSLSLPPTHPLSLSLTISRSLVLSLALSPYPGTRRRAATRGAASSWERGQGGRN